MNRTASSTTRTSKTHRSPSCSRAWSSPISRSPSASSATSSARPTRTSWRTRSRRPSRDRGADNSRSSSTAATCGSWTETSNGRRLSARSEAMSNQQPEENENLLNFIASTVEMIRDRMATKDDIARLDSKVDKLESKVDKLEVETTIIRGEVEQVHLRLDGIEKAISSRLDHVEAEMSRLRSVVYLLVKDRPDMLRLLGQTPPT